MGLIPAAYLATFVATIALTWGLTPLVLRFAIGRQILDRPELYKTQESPVPYLGGVAIVGSFAAAVIAAAAVVRPVGGVDELSLVLGLGLLLAVVGLLDDLRGLGPFVRLAVELGAALAVWRAGTAVTAFDSDVLNAVLTVGWIVGVTNAYNLLDNMDGLSAGIAAISAGFIFLLAALNGQFLVAALAIGLAGCAVGFLRHNFHPARIYMGDAGSLFIGFLVAVLGIKLRFDGPTHVTFLVPILVTGVALFDTALVTVTRLLHRRNPLAGGRDHVSHRLVFVGIPVRGAVSLVYGVGVALGWVAVVVSRVDRTSAYLLAGLVLAFAAFLAVLLGAVPVYETSRRRHMMIQEVGAHEPEPASTAT